MSYSNEESKINNLFIIDTYEFKWYTLVIN